MSTTNVSEIIRKKRDNELDVFVDARGKSNVYESLVGVTGHISSEYRGRTIIELLQNGYDPHRSDLKNGEIAILLDETEGEWGCLYVANRGSGFKRTNFESLCDISRSTKPVNQGIGNKGLGFRSVLSVCQLPQIYSRIGNKESADHFDGFCFTFPTSDELKRIYRGTNKEAYLGEIIKKVPKLLLPIEITERPEHISNFAELGFTTVLRMPLINIEAQKSIRKQIEEISDSNTPVQLFLDRLAKITIKIIPASDDSSLGLENDVLLLERKITEEWVEKGVEFQSIKISDGEEFLIVKRALAAAEFKRILIEGIESEQLPQDWIKWQDPARIAVAVRLGGLVEDGRIYNFLPMGDDAHSPLGGHLNAPFLSELDRRNIKDGIRLNEFLIESIAQLCLDAGKLLKKKKDEFAPCAIFDLTMWDGPYQEIIDEVASRALGTGLSGAQFLPVVSRAAETKWESLSRAKVWGDLEDCNFLTPMRVASDGEASLVRPTLGAIRIERLRSIAQRLIGRDLDPSDSERAHWIEAVAISLLKRKLKLSDWNKFYRELAKIFKFKAQSLVGRRILLTQNNSLATAGQLPVNQTQASKGPIGKKRRTIVFFPPIRRASGADPQEESSEYDELDDEFKENLTSEIALGTLLKKLPTSLKRRIRFLHPDLECVGLNDRSGVREFFQNGHLVSEYETRDIQRLLAHATANPGEVTKANELRRDALRFAFVLSSKGKQTSDLGEMIFFVPTKGGWLSAREAYFGRGWRDTMGGELRELVDITSGVSVEIAAVGDAMIPPYRSWPIKLGSVDEWRDFLRTIGVSDILRPVNTLSSRRWTQEGRFLAQELLERCNVKEETKKYWGERIQQFSDNIENPYTAYAPQGPPRRLPGQNEFGDFARKAKHLYAQQLLLALKDCGRGLLFFAVHRPGHPQPNRALWPSPISTFLEKAAWIPVKNRNLGQAFVPPSDAWHAPKSSPFARAEFLNIVHTELRSILESSETLLETAQNNLRLNIVNSQKSAVKQVVLLGKLATEKKIHLDEGSIFDEVYAEGWNLLLKSTTDFEKVVNGSSLDIAAHCGDEIVGFCFEAQSEDLISEPPEPDDNMTRNPTLFIDDGKEPLTRDLLRELGHPVFDFGVNDRGDLADKLAEAFPNVTKVSHVAIEILTDGEPVLLSSGAPNLIGEGRKWLLETILLAAELKAPFLKGGLTQREKMRSRLEQIRFQFVGEIVCRIGEESSPLPDFAQGSLLLRNAPKPTILLEAEDDELSWAALRRMAHSISEALGYPIELSSVLGDIFAQFETQCGSGQLIPPSDKDYEIAFRINQATLRASRRGLRHFVQNLVNLATPLVLMILGKSACNAFRSAGEDLESERELEALLAPCADKLGLASAALIETCRESLTVDDLRRTLELGLKPFNAALKALGPPYERLSFEAEQRIEFDGFCSANRQAILESLRKAHIGGFDNMESLDAYVLARGFDGLSPDPAWAIECDELTDNLLVSRLNSWLAKQRAEPVGMSQILDNSPIAEARDNNRTLVRAFASEAWRIVIAWCEKNEVDLPDIWTEGPAAQHNIGVYAGESGWLDFRLLNRELIIGWLKQDGLWPEAMPATLDLGVLDISERELDLGEQKKREERREKERRESTIKAGDHELSIDSADLPERLEQFLEDLAANDAFWAAGTRVVSLQNARTGRSKKNDKKGGQKSARSHNTKTTDKQLQAIGILGERIAFEWLKEKYPGLIDDDCWVSKNRGPALGIGGGDDNLGYDFQVTNGKVRHYFEVKATTGDENFLRLGPTQIEAALRMQGDRRERFHILFIREVTDPNHCFPNVLPNPYSAAGKNRYRIVSTGQLGLKFELSKPRR